MTPPNEFPKLEGDGHFDEYASTGKLKGKKALITSGEYVKSSPVSLSLDWLIIRIALESQ